MSRVVTNSYLNYHYPPAPEACWGGNQHQWVDTGATRPKEKAQRCFCGATRWITHIPTGELPE